MKNDRITLSIVLCATLVVLLVSSQGYAETGPEVAVPPMALKQHLLPEGAKPGKSSDKSLWGAMSSFFSSGGKEKGLGQGQGGNAKPVTSNAPPSPGLAGRPDAAAIMGPMGPMGHVPGMIPFHRPDVSREVDSKNLDLARKIVKLTEPQKGPAQASMAMHSPMMGLTMSMIPAIVQENPGQTEKIHGIAFGLQEKISAQHADDAEKDKAIAYAQTFTYSELEQLKGFYETSAGKKLLQSGGELASREGRLRQDTSMTVAEEVRSAILKALKENGIKLPAGFEQLDEKQGNKQQKSEPEKKQ